METISNQFYLDIFSEIGGYEEQILILRYMECKTQEEASHILGMDTKMFRRLEHLAVEKARELMREKT